MAAFKLYYTPTSHSAASFIVAHLAALDFDAEQVIPSAGDNNPHSVPALILPDGTMLTESLAILTYLADQSPSSGLAPQRGPRRYVYYNALASLRDGKHANFIAQVGNGFAMGNDKPSAVDILAFVVLAQSKATASYLARVAKVPAVAGAVAAMEANCKA